MSALKFERTAKFEVLDGTGTLIRTFEGPMGRGINRVAWNLRRDGFKRPQLKPQQGEGFGGGGPEVPPGKYTIRVKLGKQEASQTVEILPAPRLPVAVEAQQQKYNLILAVGAKLEVAAEAVNRIQKTRAAIEIVLGQIKDRKDEAAKNLKKQSADLKKILTRVADQFVDDPSGAQGDCPPAQHGAFML